MGKVLIVEIFDRHAEHVDPNVPLCPHGDNACLWLGETLTLTASMHVPAWLVASEIVTAESEVEIIFMDKDRIKVIINQPDYLALKKRLAEQAAQDG